MFFELARDFKKHLQIAFLTASRFGVTRIMPRKAERKVEKMNRIYRKEWDAKSERWSEEQLVFHSEEIENTETLLQLLEFHDYGRFQETSADGAETEFLIRNEDGKIIDYCIVRELLPWED